MPAERIVFWPSGRRGDGTGHMRRCVELARNLRDRGIDTQLILEEGGSGVRDAEAWRAVLPGFPFDLPLESPRLLPPGSLAVLDRRSCRREELEILGSDAAILMIDEDGPAREIASYVLDAIPGPRRSEANSAGPSWLDLPETRREPDPAGPVLVSCGGEDPAGLTRRTLDRLVRRYGVDPARISVTRPAGLAVAELPDGVAVVDAPEGLADRLADFGTVICAYGLTAWEAAAAGCAVLTVHPTPYHRRLSRSAGFPDFDDYFRARLRDVPRADRDLADAAAAVARALPGSSRRGRLANLLADLDAPENRCTACRRGFPPVIARFPDRSYYRCPRCGMIGLHRFRTRTDEYGPAYFDAEYRNQYGRSYLEDFPAIRAMAEPRLAAIRRIRPGAGRLLDIGCAYGPFLAAAADAGYDVRGIDVSEEAAAYVRDDLGLAAAAARFPDDDPARIFDLPSFDVISLWYVIEHFSDLERVLTSLAGLVASGGVLALSTPNCAGISGRRNLRRFLERSPADHYSVWRTRIARRLLARHGFEVRRIRITGHHPERMAARLRPGRIGYRVAYRISRLFRLGDTFEIYARKRSPD